jgi:hypothetical protein
MLKIRTEDGEREVLEDGERITVGAMLMDSVQRTVASTVVFDAAGHRPGGLMLTDADKQKRETLYRAYDAALTERWKAPPPVATPNNHKEPVNALNAQIGAGADAYSNYDRKIAERWRGTAAA